MRRGNIADLSQFMLDAEPGSPVHRLEYKSSGKVEVAVRAAGGSDGNGAAPHVTTSVKFLSEHAVFISCAECTYSSVRNLQELQSEVASLKRAGTWDSTWTVVTGLTKAASTTLLIASEAGAVIELELVAGTPTVPLAGGDARFRVTSEENIGFQLLCAQDAVPFVTLSRLARRPWRPTLEQLSAGWPRPPEEATEQDLLLIAVERD